MDIKPLGIAAKELIHYRVAQDLLKIRQVYDSGKDFFIITDIEYSNDMVFVTGDIINDTELKRNIRMGRSVMMALFPVKFMEDVMDNHIWGAFYGKKIAKEAEKF